MKAGRTVQTILNLAGFKNVKSKVNCLADPVLNNGSAIMDFAKI